MNSPHATGVIQLRKGPPTYATAAYQAYCAACGWQAHYTHAVDAERASAAHMAREAGR